MNVKLVEDFLIPALDSGKYGHCLSWDVKEPGVFSILWTHKSKSTWCKNDSLVFMDWDRIKNRFPPVTEKDYVDSKQRLRAAFRTIKTIREVKRINPLYRRYKITDIDEKRVPQNNSVWRCRSTSSKKKQRQKKVKVVRDFHENSDVNDLDFKAKEAKGTLSQIAKTSRKKKEKDPDFKMRRPKGPSQSKSIEIEIKKEEVVGTKRKNISGYEKEVHRLLEATYNLARILKNKDGDNARSSHRHRKQPERLIDSMNANMSSQTYITNEEENSEEYFEDSSQDLYEGVSSIGIKIEPHFIENDDGRYELEQLSKSIKIEPDLIENDYDGHHSKKQNKRKKLNKGKSKDPDLNTKSATAIKRKKVKIHRKEKKGKKNGSKAKRNCSENIDQSVIEIKKKEIGPQCTVIRKKTYFYKQESVGIVEWERQEKIEDDWRNKKIKIEVIDPSEEQLFANVSSDVTGPAVNISLRDSESGLDVLSEGDRVVINNSLRCEELFEEFPFQVMNQTVSDSLQCGQLIAGPSKQAFKEKIDHFGE